MSDKLSVSYKEDISKIIDEMVKTQGIYAVGDIVKALLEHYDHKLLIDMIRNKADSKPKSQNDFFIVGLDVYRYVYDNECDMKVARIEISDKSLSSERTNFIKESTIKTHLDNFRIQIKKDMKELVYPSTEKDSLNSYIRAFFTFYDSKDYPYWGNDMLKKSDYKKAYRDFMRKGAVPF